MKRLVQRKLSLIMLATGMAIGLLGLASALLVALSRDGAQAASPGLVDVGMPVATIVPFGGSTSPPGWLIADGSEVSRTQYADLFAVIGTTYGAGNGTTTFNLPDLR